MAETENSELLRKKLVSVETEVKPMLRKMKFFLGKEMDDIEDYHKKSTKERDEINITLKKMVDQLQLGVRKFQEHLKNKSFSCENTEDLKVLSKELASDICLTREQLQNGYKSLNYEFHELDENILELEARLHAWCSFKDTRVRHVPILYVQNGNRDGNLPPEVVAFQDFVYQSGGHTGGWDGHDHQKFLQLKKKYKDENTFLKQATTELIGLTEQQILDHKTWFQEYLTKKEAKEIVIQEWKKNKEEKRKLLISSEADIKPEMTITQKNMQREQLEEREKKLEKIKEWKASKEAERVLKEKKLEEEKKQEQKKWSRYQQKRAVIKQRLEEHRKQQEDLERQKRENELKESKKIDEILRSKDREKIAEFQKKDKQWLHRKEERQQRKEEDDLLRDKRLARLKKEVSVTAVRDPSRLLEPTEIWKVRRHSFSDSKETCPQVKIFHRAVPEWRKGLYIW
ncbi:coiled-coil domain-containing protein 112-like isoform X2 [Tachypleus tridentatus]|uniref:coiled-coil domain-containing protein 112-like isoform X2 n=1 Tax=Tachypleus tridentatus TaxID=6853 RepID=UPI003FD5209E